MKQSPSDMLQNIRAKKSRQWKQVGEKAALRLFHAAAKRIPAYKDFLRKNRVNSGKVKTFRDFSCVPPTSKENYLHFYPFERLFWDGTIKKPLTLHATSGSTGEPTYFQRDQESDGIRKIIIESFLRNHDATLTGPTLFIITFGMGVWSAGMGIYSAVYLANNTHKFPISIITPGVNKIEVAKILKKLSHLFKQVIIAGYPPFVKDVIDNAIEDGVDVKKMNLRIVFTGEAFTEEFRDYLLAVGAVKNIFTDTMNTYGTSELGAIAVETPLTVFGRRLAYKDENVFSGLFGTTTKTPTLAQYIPHFVNFECLQGELFLTGKSPAPLIRYASGDHGGIFSFEEFRGILEENGIDLSREILRLGIARFVTELPLVYVYERKNLATTLYGILIYPEFVKAALFERQLTKFLTGKFTMITKYDRHHNQHLEINLELRRSAKYRKAYAIITEKRILKILRERSSEFRELSDHMKERPLVKLVFWPYEHPQYFTLGNKHKWVKKP